MRCLEKTRERRFSNVAELASALTPFAPPRAAAHAERAARVLRAAQTARPITVQEPGSSGVGSHARMRAIRRPIDVRRKRLGWILLMLFAGTCVLFGVLRALSPLSAPPSPIESQAQPPTRASSPLGAAGSNAAASSQPADTLENAPAPASAPVIEKLPTPALDRAVPARDARRHNAKRVHSPGAESSSPSERRTDLDELGGRL
jgi:hypothetical protein